MSPDSSTFFTTSGMQQYKDHFSDQNHVGTITNIQKCLRLHDLSEVGDGTHYLSFEMIGLFSFRQWTVPQTIDFFMEFLSRLNIKPDYVTIHPDKIEEWKEFYQGYELEIREDKECLWSDGSIGGYSTEFYKDGVEIGNIVNPLGSCIDVGFGLERLVSVGGGEKIKTRLEILEDTSFTLIDSGINIGHNGHSFILKKIITECILEESVIDHPFFNEVRKRQLSNYNIFLRNYQKPQFQKHKEDRSFWFERYGVDIDRLEKYQQLEKRYPS